MQYSNDAVVINGSYPLWVVILFVAIVVLEITLKGMALYRSARNGSKGWFVIFLLINTAGILPLLYLVFSKNKSQV